MAVDFPNNPSIGQTFLVGNITYIWDGSTWDNASPVNANTLEGNPASYFINTSSSAQTKTGNLNVSGTVTGTVIASSASAGVAPFITSSSANVANLNADYLDGQHATYFINTSASTQTKTGDLTIQGTGTLETLDLNETQVTSKIVLINVTTPVLLDSFNYSTYRGVEYLLQIKQNLNYAMTKILLLHDSGTNVALTEYGYVNIGSDISYTFSTAYNGSNVELYATCSTATITPVYFTLYRTLFDG